MPKLLLFLFSSLALLVAASTASAVTYEFRQTPGGTVIGTMEIAEPPGSSTSGWTTSTPADVLSLYLDDTLFGLGTGDVLASASAFWGFSVGSADGSELDSGWIQDQDPDPFANGIGANFDLGFADLSMGPAYKDVVESFVTTAWIQGNWTLGTPVPEPGTGLLLGIGLIGLAAKRRAL